LILLLALAGGATLFLAAVGAFALALEQPRAALQLALARRSAFFVPRIIVLGDSLAACCPFRKLCRLPFGVLSLARGGATLKEIAGQALQVRDIAAEWIVVDGGLNDLLTDAATPERIAEDFSALLRRLPPGRRFVFALAPFTSDPTFTQGISAANARMAALCAETGVTALDLNPELSANGARLPVMSTDDGLHFSPAANAVWLAALRQIMASPPPVHFRATKNSLG
jgi:hypothetical protein